MKADFFPSGVSVITAEPWMWGTPVHPLEEQLLSPAAALKRKGEFRAGRHCAQQALQQLGIEPFPVLRGERGEPLWPEGVCGSISHAGERCIAVVARKTDYLSIAVDIEKDRAIKDDTLARISRLSERVQLEQAPAEWQSANLRAILFSAKECVHKIYYPLNRYTLDFQDVSLVFRWRERCFDVHIDKPERPLPAPIERLSGCFGYTAGYVYTRIVLRPDSSCA